MMNRKFIRILSIILAVLMALSAVAVLASVFAIDAPVAMIVPTGDNDLDTMLPIAIGVIAVVAVVACLVFPKLSKKKANTEEE